MLNDNLSILIIPQKNGKVFRFGVSPLIINVLIITFGILFAASCAIFYDYLVVLNKAQKEDQLEKAVMLQEFRKKQITNSLFEYRQQMKKYEAFDRKLRVISGLEESGSRVQLVGGGESFSFFRREGDSENKVIAARLKKISLDIKVREISFFQLEAELQERRDRLARTPSTSPTKGHLSSRFGKRVDPFTGKMRFHNGLDWSNRPYTPIYAPADGVVVNTFTNGGYGEFLVIDHGYNIVTRYGHLAKYEVSVGQKIKRGALIARMGNTGRSTAPHLHYEVLVNDQHVDPEKYILDLE